MKNTALKVNSTVHYN